VIQEPANHDFRALGSRKRIAGLSPKQQELIRPVLEAPRDFLFMSIRALASKLSTDTATLLRIVRAMGFRGYPDFRRFVHELTIANATSLDSMLSKGGNDSEIPTHVRDSLDQDQKNFIALRNTLDTRQFGLFIDLLSRAPPGHARPPSVFRNESRTSRASGTHDGEEGPGDRDELSSLAAANR